MKSLLLIPMLAGALHAADDFSKGNDAFESGDFPAAITNYQAQLETGLTSPALHFNLAHASYEAGQLGRSIFHYRRALALAPRDGGAQHNLGRVRDEVHNGTPPKAGFWRRLTGYFTINEWTVAAAALLTAWWLWLAAINWRPQWRKRGAVVRPIVGTVALVLAALAIVSWRLETDRPWAVVVQKEVSVRYGPVAASPEHFKWFDGAELRVRDTHTANGAKWILARDPTGRQGWLPVSAVLRPGG
ncbi:MAG TPA: tetratricopeptide repeat protein [Verrucomicrobia bacterium]|nr:tetratricopeptide repeat protein [Verrucomicrobiota bacterium]